MKKIIAKNSRLGEIVGNYLALHGRKTIKIVSAKNAAGLTKEAAFLLPEIEMEKFPIQFLSPTFYLMRGDNRTVRKYLLKIGFPPVFHRSSENKIIFSISKTFLAAGKETEQTYGFKKPEKNYNTWPYGLYTGHSKRLQAAFFKFRNRGKYTIRQTNAGYCDYMHLDTQTNYYGVYDTHNEAYAELCRMGGANYKIGGTYESGRGNFDVIKNDVVML